MKREKLIQGSYLILMTLLLTIFSIINFPIKVLAAENITIESAPLNPAYTEYLKEAHSSTGESVTSKGNKLGYVPSPFSPLGKKPLNGAKVLLGSSQVPTSYDLRTKNKLTSVKAQGDADSGWAFATYGSLESNLKMTESVDFDFSENNLKNQAGFDIASNEFGNAAMAIAYLARWDGPVSEKDDPYIDTSTSSPEKSTQKHVQEVLRFNYVDNYTDIKQALMKNGAVFTAIRYQEDSYNSKNNTYYYRGDESANHAVDIVGWDDNFDKNKFADLSSEIPLGNGAFIARNSFGSSWGDKGYFYISYYDSLIGLESVMFNNAEPLSNYSSVYQYDPLGQTTPVQFRSDPNVAWFANVFTANSNDALSAVSFYTNGPNSKYEIWLYDYDRGTFSKNKSLSSGTIDYAGYHTIKLAKSSALITGSKFAVAVKLTTPGEDPYPYPLALEEPIAGYSSQAKSERGQSFVSLDGDAWTDLNDTDYSNANVCLKVFTSAKSIKTLKVDPSSVTILQGETQSIVVQAIDSEGFTENVTSLVEANSNNTKVAIVNSGKIEAITPGKAKITLTYLGKKVTIDVLVSTTFELQASLNPVTVEKDKSVKVKIEAAYSNGKSDDITSKVMWATNPFDIQNVSVDKGTVTGLIMGDTTVMVSYLGKSLRLPINVIAQLTTLIANPNTLAITIGDQSTPQVIATYGKEFEDVSTKCSAVSSRPSVATVTDGVITGIARGTAVITYTYGSKVATIKVTVSKS